jgi:predicted RNase H-like HicB family nuclease
MKINIIVEKEGNIYGAKVKQMPGVFTSGDNIEEIKSNIYESLELHLESLNESVENAKKIEFEKLKIEFNFK